MYTTRILLILGLVAATGLVFFLRGSADEAGPGASSSARAAAPERTVTAAAAPAMPGARPAAGAETDHELIEHLQAEYGASIEHPSVQMRMLEKLMRYFQERYPDRWQEALLAAVRAAFPEHYDRIAELLRDRLAYEAWVKENRVGMNKMPSDERYEAMQQKREELFGAEIADELWASELKNRAVREALETIDAQEGAITDKLAMYRESLADIHGDKVDSFLERHRHQAMTQFFDLSSVQGALAGMNPNERRQTMREIRKGMGLDEEALARWDTLDQTRDQRWDQGARYMAERAALAETHAGDELEQRVHELRVRYFGNEAETIRSEEQGGFFRFDRERQYGRN
jgi:predicted RNA-binding protein with PUA domain